LKSICSIEELFTVFEQLLKSGKLSIFTSTLSFKIVQLLLSILILHRSLIAQLFQLDFLVYLAVLKLGLNDSMVSFDLLDLSVKLVNLHLGLLHLRDDGVLAFMLLLKFPLVLALLCLPFLLHLPLDLVFELRKLFLCVFSDDLLTV